MPYFFNIYRNLGQIIKENVKRKNEGDCVSHQSLGGLPKISSVVFLFFSIVFLTACGVSSPNDPDPDATPKTNTAPIALFLPSVKQTIKQGASISFDASGSSDSDGDTPLKYAWSIDGVLDTALIIANPVIQFDVLGLHKVSLTVTDSRDLASKPTAIDIDVVENTNQPPNSPPLAVITTTPPADSSDTINITAGESVSFSGIGSFDPDSSTEILTYAWTFTGGDMQSSDLTEPGSIQYNTVSTAEGYSANLTVMDSLGLLSIVSKINVVVFAVNENLPPSAIITTIPVADDKGIIKIIAGKSVSFSGSKSTDPDSTDTLKYAWTFTGGDKLSSDLADPGSIKYNTASPTSGYLATLTVTDSLGLSTEFSVTVVVVDNQPPIADITTTPPFDGKRNINIITGQSVSFSGSNSIDPDSTGTLTYAWIFAGESQTESTLKVPGSIQYNKAGSYAATLMVTDGLGLASSETSVTVVVDNQPPITVITTTPAVDGFNNININVGQSVSFSGSSSTDPDGNTPLTYAWTFVGGNSTSSDLAEPGSIQYNTASTAVGYPATLTVTDSLGLSSQTITVNIVVSQLPVGKTKTITLVEMNDLHAHLTAHDDLTRLPNGTSGLVKRGGVARIATEIKRIRAENPATAFMNIGDTFHGGVEAFYSEGTDIEAAVNALGIDVGVPGNWDFAYGPLVTRARFTLDHKTSTLNYQNIAANWFDANFITGQIKGPILPETFKMNLGGITVGFIGLTSDIVPDMSDILVVRMAFTKGEQEYLSLIKTHADALRAGANPAQVVVVMSELGIHKDKQLADKISSGLVDVFFSAHTHELTTTPLISTSGALVVEAGDDTYLGRMDIVLDQNNVIIAKNWTTIPLEMSITPDLDVEKIVTKVRAKYLIANPNLTNPSFSSTQMLVEPINTVLTTTNRMIARDHALENSFNNLMTDLIKAETGTDIAISRGFRFGAYVAASGMAYEDSTVIAAGDFTIEDAYRFIPVPYTLSTGDVTGARLKQIIEQSLTTVFSPDAFSQLGGWVDGFSGLSMMLDVSASDGKRLQSLTLSKNGSPISDMAAYSITGCVRPIDKANTLCAYTGITNLKPVLNGVGASYTGIDLLLDGLRSARFQDTVVRTDIFDSSATQFWPISEFVQPINGAP